MNHEEQPVEAGMRRKPQRARGQQRVGLILDAAEQLFAEAGYEATTTNAIAARANIPIGSIYQFFPNKEAILHALAQRYRAGFAEFFDAQLTPETLELSASELAGRMIEAMVEFGGAHSAFTRIVLQGQGHPHTAAAAASLQQDLFSRLDGLLALRAPWLEPRQRQLYANVSLTAVMALLSQAIGAKVTGDFDHALRLIAEARRLLVAYLERVTGEG
jgi:AcrR family transcriptional regulator